MYVVERWNHWVDRWQINSTPSADNVRLSLSGSGTIGVCPLLLLLSLLRVGCGEKNESQRNEFSAKKVEIFEWKNVLSENRANKFGGAIRKLRNDIWTMNFLAAKRLVGKFGVVAALLNARWGRPTYRQYLSRMVKVISIINASWSVYTNHQSFNENPQWLRT